MAAPSSRAVSTVVAELTAVFAEAGIDSPRVDARVLVAHVLGVEPASLFARGNDPFPAAYLPALTAIRARRLAREPVARIRGYREFFGHEYIIGPATLEPRADSETLVEAALNLRSEFRLERPVRVLDLGTGSGCLLLSILAAWPDAHGVGVDLAPAAIEVANANAARLGLSDRTTFLVSNWCAVLSEKFDLIVSNPPYIAGPDMDGLEPEVLRFDPLLALNGGNDGLDAYRAIVPELAKYMEPGGAALLEVGHNQAATVAALCAAHGLAHKAFHNDLAGIPRVVQVASI
ncbi:MAG: peptide chain release factor N(5)-glutamine methyltransferase [Rhodospirillaceae bacterium]|nr:MAG: peptide chain release factor N(5)-glutamine methyltransferase [Rhodospirillaceae bacterium]